MPIVNNGTIHVHAVHIQMYSVHNSTKHPKRDIIPINSNSSSSEFNLSKSRLLSQDTDYMTWLL